MSGNTRPMCFILTLPDGTRATCVGDLVARVDIEGELPSGWESASKKRNGFHTGVEQEARAAFIKGTASVHANRIG